MNNNFLIAIIKPTGLTSSDVVVKVRRIISNYYGEKVKVGHMGTLDPGASGVLLVGVNKAARLFDYTLTKKKTYIGQLTFGVSTDTQDSYGKVVNNSDKPLYDNVIKSLDAFKGEIKQIPPKYSALKINGQKGYDLARNDVDFEFESRKVTIYDLKEIRNKQVDGKLESIDLSVECSSGTYIRTLFSDIARYNNVDGYMSYLIRTKLMNIDLKDCVTIDQLELHPEMYHINPLVFIKELMQVIELEPKVYTHIANGIGEKLPYNDEFLAVRKNGKLDFILKNIDGEYKSVTNLQ